MIRKLRFGLVLVGLLAVLILFQQFLMVGQATEHNRLVSFGQLALDKGLLVSVQFLMDIREPNHLDEIVLDFSAAGAGNSIDEAMISLNGGELWVKCSHEHNRTWVCACDDQHIHAEDINQIEVVVN